MTSPTIQPATFLPTSTAPKIVAMPTMPTMASSRVDTRSCQPRGRDGVGVGSGCDSAPGCSGVGPVVGAELSVTSHCTGCERRHDVPPYTRRRRARTGGNRVRSSSPNLASLGPTGHMRYQGPEQRLPETGQRLSGRVQRDMKFSSRPSRSYTSTKPGMALRDFTRGRHEVVAFICGATQASVPPRQP